MSIMAPVVVLSGAAALVFETLLFRLCGLTLGNGVWAVSLVLGSFMAGLALGNGLAARLAPRIRRPLRLYARLEILIALSGLGLVAAMPQLPTLLAPILTTWRGSPIGEVIRLGTAFGLMLVPATAMGMTLPVLVGGVHRGRVALGGTLGALYGWNTAGAVLGVLAAERFLLGNLGILGTGGVAAGLDLLAAGLVLRMGEVDREPEPAATETAPTSWARGRLLTVAAGCGFLLLTLEVVWFRLFLMLVNGYAWNLAVMLAVVLAGIAVGGRLAGAWCTRRPGADAWLAAVCFLTGILGAGAYRVVASGVAFPSIFVLQVVLMFPVSVASGTVFTLLGQALLRQGGTPMGATGAVTLANTLGAAGGALTAGLLAIPRFGIEGSLFLVVAAYGLLGILAHRVTPDADRRVAPVLAMAWLGLVASFPFGTLDGLLVHASGIGPALASQGYREVLYREGPTETIRYFRKDLGKRPYRFKLVTNCHSMSDTTIMSLRYMKLYTYWALAVHPDARRALLISYGLGSTAKSLVDSRTLESIDMVDISADVLATNRVVYPEDRDYPPADPRVRTHVEDGRHFLLTTSEPFDLITAEPPPPKFQGVVNLYTREFFQLVHDRLAPGGVVTYWLPVYQLERDEAGAIINAFLAAFPEGSLWTGGGMEWMLAARKPGGAPASAEAFARQWHDPVVRPELEAVGLPDPGMLGALYLADGERLRAWTRDVPPLTDGFPGRLRPHPPRRDDRRDYLELMFDPDRAGAFEGSPALARIWPAALRRAAGPWFSHGTLFADLAADQPPLRILDLTLSDPRLAPFVVRAMGSDAHAQAILAGLSDPPEWTRDLLRHAAAAAADRREFSRAAQLLGEATRHAWGSGRRPAHWVLEARIYLHTRAGEDAAAADLVSTELERLADPEAKEELERFLVWCRERPALPTP